jgi:glycosyl transferase family 87
MLLEKEDLGKSYDSSYFNKKVKEYGIKDVYDIQPNIPTNSFVYLPVALLSPQPAKIAWGILSIVFLLVSVILIIKVFEIPVRENLGMLTLILILVWHPVYLNLALGQVYLFLLFLFCLSMKALANNSQAKAAVPISLCLLSKGYGWIIFLWFLIKRKWKAALVTILSIIIGFLLTLYFIRWDTWLTYWNVIASHIGRNPTDSFVAYQNINSFLRHLFIFDKDLNPFPLLNLPEPTVFVIVVITNLAVILIVSLRMKNTLPSYSAFLGLGIITAPIAEEYSYVLFLPLAIILFKYFYEQSKTIIVQASLFATAILLIALPLDYKSLQFSSFPLWLLAYPKLYAGIILLICYYIMTKSGVNNNER